MLQRTLRPAALALLLLLCAPLVVRAQEPLENFPATSAVAIRFSSIDQFVNNFDDMLSEISPVARAATGEFRDGIADMLGLTKEGLAAVDTSAPVYVCALPLEVNDPFAALVKATDLPALHRSLLRIEGDAQPETQTRDDGFSEVAGANGVVYFKQLGEYVLYTKSAEVLTALTKAKSDNLAARLNSAARGEFMEGDAALAVNAAYLTEKFQNEIEQARSQIMDGIDSLPDEQLEAGGANPADVKQMYKDLANSAFTVALDTQILVANVSFSGKGVQAGGLASLKEGSSTDKFAAANPPTELETLGLLPAGAPIYYGMSLGESTIARFIQAYMNLQMGGGGQTAEYLAEGQKLMEAAGMQAIVGSFALPPDDKTGLMATSITTVRDPASMLQASQKMVSNYGNIQTPFMSMAMDFQAKAETYKGAEIDLVTQKITVDPNSAEGAILAPFFEKMFGGMELQSRMAVKENLVISASGNGPERMHSVLDGMESGEGVLGVSDAYGPARDQLTPKANLVFFMDLPRLVVDGVKLIEDVEPFGAALAGIGAMFNFRLDPAPSYAAGSLSMEEHGVRFRGFISVDQPRNMFRIFAPGAF